MTRFRHFAIVALALMACTVSAFAHIPRDVLNPTLSLSPLRVHSCSFVVLSPDASRVAAVTVESGSTNTTVFVLDYTGPLRRAYEGAGGETRLAYACILGLMGDATAVPTLPEIVKAANVAKAVQERVVAALGYAQDLRAVPALLKLLEW